MRPSSFLGAQGATALSGGTDLIGRMKDYVSSPERVVYLKDIKELAGISGDSKSSGLTIGAGTRLTDIVANAEVTSAYPALWQATIEVGSPQIRNMATLGGNLLQRPRCWYFRAGHGLLGMQDGKSLVRCRRQPVPLDLHDRRRRSLRQPVEPGCRLCALDAPGIDHRARRAHARSKSKSSTGCPSARPTASSRSSPARSSPR